MLVISILMAFLTVVKCDTTDTVPYTSEVLSSGNKTTNLSFRGHSYYFGTAVKVNFFQAHRLCKLEHMDLVYIDSVEENERLGIFATQLGHGQGNFWTSGNNLHDFQEWTWLSTGQRLKYTHWYPGEPNLGASGTDLNERCMEARTLDKGVFTWNNVPCERLYYYICKKAKTSCAKNEN